MFSQITFLEYIPKRTIWNKTKLDGYFRHFTYLVKCRKKHHDFWTLDCYSLYFHIFFSHFHTNFVFQKIYLYNILDGLCNLKIIFQIYN